MTKKLIQTAFLLALGEVAYIALVATLMFTVGRLFGDKPDPPIIAPIAFLLLFVISVSVSGALILGKPVMLYLDGQKSDAIKLFGLTLAHLAVFLLIAFSVVAMQ